MERRLLKTVPAEWTRFTTLEAHTAGEPLRIVIDGLPPIPGDTIVAKRRFAREHLEPLRKALMWEPRGHADMYGAVLTEPVTDDGDTGVLFMHNEGFSTMCGHGVIALAKVLLDTGMVDRKGDEVVLRLDTPAGRITATACRRGGVVEEVSFLNVPSFVYASDREVAVAGMDPLPYDLAFGGAFYAIVDAQELGLDLDPGELSRLIELGMKIKERIARDVTIEHPDEKELGFLYGVIFVGPARDPAFHSRNVCVFASGEVDRSPTGTGVSARAALHFTRGTVGLNEPFVVESILGTTMTGCAKETAQCGPYPAVIPEITGKAFLTGRNEWWIDPDDPLGQGFFLR